MKNMQSIPLFSEGFWSLGFLVFSSGAMVMALELVASRILIPVFGSTTYTWGSLIGVILAGLSLGYFLGGKIADKNPKFQKICSIIFSAGLYTIFIPFIAPSVLGFSISVLPASQYTSLLAAFVLLMLPTTLLGFVSPYSIKLATHTLKKVGNISGNLYSLATIGSILGTFLTVFVLIPTISVREIIFGIGITLMITSLIGLKAPPKIVVLVVALLLFVPWSSAVVGLVPHIGESVYEKETPYSHLDVTDSGKMRTLFLNGMPHSIMNLDDPSELVMDYTQYFHLGGMFNSDFEKVLFIGGGGFSGPKNFLSTYPDILIDVVEIDPDVIDVAKTYFAVNDDPRLRIFNEDARNFLTNNNDKYDLIILDAYATNYVPFHLLTTEYFQILDSRLQPRGIVVSNLLGSLVGDTSDLFRAAYRTMDEIFPTLYVFKTEHPIGNNQNLMLVATKIEKQYDKDELFQLATEKGLVNLLDNFDKDHIYNEKIKTNDVPLLTDQFSPVESLLNPVTSKPFTKEGFGFSSTESKIGFSESTRLTFGVLLAVVLFWPFHLYSIWKKDNN